MVRIYWFNPETRLGGHGEPLVRAIAEAWIDEMRRKHPRLVHWLVPA